jgi:HPr kinase/phosphorylase
MSLQEEKLESSRVEIIVHADGSEPPVVANGGPTGVQGGARPGGGPGGPDPDITSPGLALAGYTAASPTGRMQVFGETEMTYLARSTRRRRGERLDTCSRSTSRPSSSPRASGPGFFLEVAGAAGDPGVPERAQHRTSTASIKPYLEAALAPSTTLHGSLADVYGVGLLFVGKSGVGKSECVLDLVERGHRLVADDLVLVSGAATTC